MGERSAGRGVSVGVCLAVVGLGLIGGWRWWLGPSRDARATADASELASLREAVVETLAGFGIPARLQDRRASNADLRWRAPGECVEVYRVRIDEHHRDASVAGFLGRAEEHGGWTLALAGAPEQVGSDRAGSDRAGVGVRGVLVPAAGEDQVRVRELWWGALEVGPRAPDLACRRRSWDPLEDALALGWPRLPGTPLRVGETWRGSAVEGRCHETVCVEPDGRFGHATPCRARPWSEQLVGAQDGLLAIRGDWDDGHDPARSEIGILTSREVVIDEGRPLYVRAVIEQRWAGVRRELALVRIDDCGARSLASDADAQIVADTRGRFRDEFRARLSRPVAGG